MRLPCPRRTSFFEFHRAHGGERIVDVVEGIEIDVQLVVPIAATLHERIVLALKRQRQPPARPGV